MKTPGRRFAVVLVQLLAIVAVVVPIRPKADASRAASEVRRLAELRELAMNLMYDVDHRIGPSSYENLKSRIDSVESHLAWSTGGAIRYELVLDPSAIHSKDLATTVLIQEVDPPQADGRGVAFADAHVAILRR